MLACSGVLLGVGVCPNPSVTSRTGAAINKNTFFMKFSWTSFDDFLRRGGLEFH
jgi:hypothetical protein